MMISFRTVGAIILGTAMFWLTAVGSADAEKVKVLIHSAYAADMQPLTDEFPDLELVAFSTGDELLANVKDAAAIVGLAASHPTAELVSSGQKLKWMQTSSAGVESNLREAVVRNSEIVLTNAKIIMGPEIADHAMALLLTHTRDLKFHLEQMTESGFNRTNRLPQIELRGKTALIVGLGGIGTQVAERCFAFGMRVLAVDPKDIPYMRAVEEVRKPDELNQLLPEADVVISCTPHTPASEGMIGSEQFALMKDDVYFINVSRGKVVDTQALTAALTSGKVRAAGLDVTEPEPLPAGHVLWTLPNVIITPHNATNSDRLRERRVRLFRENIQRFLSDRPLHNVVNKQSRF